MPIEMPFTPKKLNDAEFDKLDYKVIGNAFKVHNEFGGLLDELCYKRKLLGLCKQSFSTAEIEVPVTVKFDRFSKIYKIDLLIDDSAVYELKAVESISRKHFAQTLNYLIMTQLKFGRVVNFRGEKVTDKIVISAINDANRYIYNWNYKSPNITGNGRKLLNLLSDVFDDLSCYLTPCLYTELINTLIGEKDSVDIMDGDNLLGVLPMNYLSDYEGFHITGSADCPKSYSMQLQKLINKTNLDVLHWINIHHGVIDYLQIKRQ